jgi:hypothetical protein
METMKVVQGTADMDKMPELYAWLLDFQQLLTHRQ